MVAGDTLDQHYQLRYVVRTIKPIYKGEWLLLRYGWSDYRGAGFTAARQPREYAESVPKNSRAVQQELKESRSERMSKVRSSWKLGPDPSELPEQEFGADIDRLEDEPPRKVAKLAASHRAALPATAHV